MEPWDRLIRAAETRMPEVVELLRRLRDVGCELERQSTGRWRIRYGKAVASGRMTEAEVRDGWLKPNTDKLRAALVLLERPEPAQEDAEQTTTAEPDVQVQTGESSAAALDPRQDLASDHAIWEIILAEARARSRVIGTFTAPDGSVHPMHLEELFHALRCFGVTVETRAGRTGPYLRLVWEHVCDPYKDEDGRMITWMTREAFRAWVLDPYKTAISEHLKHVMEVIQREGVPYAVRTVAA